MIPLSLSPRAWGAIGVALVIVALVGWAMRLDGLRADYKSGWADEKTAHERTVSNYRTAAEQRRASDLQNQIAVGATQTQISKEITDDYQARIARLRADFAERVRLATAAHPGGPGGTDLPRISAAAGRTDGAACKAVFPAQDALIASETAERLIALQEWARKQAAVDVNGSPAE